MLVDHRDSGGAFADRPAHALDRARAHVADGKHPRHRRLERSGHARSGFAGLTGQHETLLIELDAATLQPFGFRVRADE